MAEVMETSHPDKAYSTESDLNDSDGGDLQSLEVKDISTAEEQSDLNNIESNEISQEVKQTDKESESTEQENIVSSEEKKSIEDLMAEDDEKCEYEKDSENLSAFGNDLDSQSRNILYEKGVQFKRKGENQRALHCFLSCLKGLEPRCQFTNLPECLHNVAEIYSSEEDYENAIQFIQAEKIYYETALIEVGQEEKTVSEEWKSFGGDLPSETLEGSFPIKVIDPNATEPEAIRANEYERLAIMCLKRENVQLALEYSGKATKIRQGVYGESHPITAKSLDLFTTIYAEMGKVQYSAAMEKFSQAQKKTAEEKAAKKTESLDSSELSSQEKTEEKQVPKNEEESKEETSLESEDNEGSSDAQMSVSITRGEALFLYFLLTVITALLVVFCCSYWTGKDIPSTYSYMIRRLKFYYYSYIQSPAARNKYF